MAPMENDYQPASTPEDQPRGFATTHWSLVLAAGERRGAESDRALEQLCRAYWTPLYAYVRRRVNDVHEAQDLTQAFFERLLEKRYLAQANPQRGRFRSFLITAFKHFLAKEWERARAEKRGGRQVVLSFDFAARDCTADDATDQGTPERAYERQWAIALLNRVMNRLQREMERSGKGRQFQTLKEFIGANQSSYVEAAAELGMSESAARMATSRLRGRYRELLRDEIAHTVIAPDEIDEEIRDLFATFTE
jgi:RNA polymerase sigma-70 factor (ECF subfamily)